MSDQRLSERLDVLARGASRPAHRDDRVDEAARAMDAKVPGSCTAELPLVGADGYLRFRNTPLPTALIHSTTSCDGS